MEKESCANTLIGDKFTLAEGIEQHNINSLKEESCANTLIGDNIFVTETKSQGTEQQNINSFDNKSARETITSRLNEENSVSLSNTDCLGKKICK